MATALAVFHLACSEANRDRVIARLAYDIKLNEFHRLAPESRKERRAKCRKAISGLELVGLQEYNSATAGRTECGRLRKGLPTPGAIGWRMLVHDNTSAKSTD
jgi:hypothetical protein